MFRALAWLRIALLANAVGLNVYRDNFDHPAAGWVSVGVMVVWTGVALVRYRRPEHRTQALLIADLGVAAAMMAVTPLIKGSWFSATIPGFWVAGALFAWGIRYGWRGGLFAGVVLAGIDLIAREHIEQKDYSLVFLMVLGGATVGYLCGSLQEMAAERDRAQRRAAAEAERTRLGRAVHDGVLQVLALVQRRGAELGGTGAELSRLAAEQEEALRALIRVQSAVDTEWPTNAATADPPTETDLASALGALAARRHAEVALPGSPVLLPTEAVGELLGAVGACLDNVARHVGEDAPAWILLEDLGDRVVVSVRDEGPGIPEERLAAAEADGRWGVSESIRGRLRDLGGQARLETGPHGTEWELELRRDPAATDDREARR
ncbi:histidine kinase [Nocardioides sp. BGMRC 2183]|nr:histidine kinase [Nocardioides sp. BGMRC 2183]